MKLGRAVYNIDRTQGFFPYFTMTLRHRIKQKMAVNVAVVGEAGVGKSYMAYTLCLEIDRKFTVDQIVYKYSEYMRLLQKLRMGGAIMFDEPSYAMGKRDWYKQLNKVLVQTIESQRFKVHPLFIPIINMTLLDKTIRDHLIQFVVHVLRRGFAFVYRIHPSQWEDKIYHPYICKLRYPLVGTCKRESCLGCRKLKSCREFRAVYERKKAIVQDERYQQAEEDAGKIEAKEFTIQQLGEIAYALRSQFIDDEGKINVKTMRYVLRKKLNLFISVGKGYDVKEWLVNEYKDVFLDRA